MAMDANDFREARGEKATRVEDVRRELQAPGLAGLRSEVAAPIISGAEVLGVISMGGVRARKGQEKKLLTMVGELTAIALSLAARLKATEQAEGQDGLTGVASKPALMKRVEEEIQRAGRDNQSLSVLFLDVDHLEQYNRNHGSRAGDEVLCRMAQLLTSKVRKDDIVARFGGEEFVVVFVGAPKGPGAAPRRGRPQRHRGVPVHRPRAAAIRRRHDLGRGRQLPRGLEGPRDPHPLRGRSHARGEGRRPQPDRLSQAKLSCLSWGALRRAPQTPLALAEVNSARALPAAWGEWCCVAPPRPPRSRRE
jgi:GGDEF domain-containing protein